MSRRAKHVLLIIAAQTVFLAVGLWMQQRYVHSAALQKARERAWSDLERSGSSLISELGGPGVLNREYGPSTIGELSALLEFYRPSVGEVTVTDRDGRVIFTTYADRLPDGAPMILEQPVEWIPELSWSEETSSTVPGRLHLPDGKHFGIAFALKNEQGHLLLHQPAAPIEADAAALVESAPSIAIMTFLWTGALLCITLYILISSLHDDMEQQRSRSATDGLRQTKNLVRTRDAIIFGLAKLAESRDPETGGHLERISVYSTTLAQTLRHDPRFSEAVTPAFVRLIGISSALHDIGKVGVEDHILRKPSLLTLAERLSMQDHTVIGGECLREIEQRLGGSNFLQMAREIAFAHHEQWNGNGYPKGLAGKAIPLAARIVAIVDVYDALSSKRVYKRALSHDECVENIRKEAGQRFDPDLVEVWLTVESKFSRIAQSFVHRGEGRNATAETTVTASALPVEDNVEDFCGVSSAVPIETG